MVLRSRNRSNEAWSEGSLQKFYKSASNWYICIIAYPAKSLKVVDSDGRTSRLNIISVVSTHSDYSSALKEQNPVRRDDESLKENK